MEKAGQERDPMQVMRLILELRQAGITDNNLLNAFEALPREKFIPEAFQEYAYEDVALPIACGQTISRPSTTAGMVDALELGATRSMTLLEIGTGSGFMTALLSRFCRRVYTIDRYRTLSQAARVRFDSLGLSNIISQCSDGELGWPSSAPFDRIVSTCAMEEPSEVWLGQLKPGGMLIMPIGTNEDQQVVRLRKLTSGEVTKEPLAPSKFLHIIPGAAKEL